MKRWLFIFTGALLPLLGGCAHDNLQTYEYYLINRGLEQKQTAQSFQHCHGYGCKFISTVNFKPEDWRPVKAAFSPTPATPEQERQAIRNAIAVFEQKAGALAGTQNDHWGTFRKTGSYQHDCVDESTNTTVYLLLLQQQGLLRFHKLEAPTARLPVIHAGRWPHQSALISEIETSKFFAVDSWFHDNGAPPEIVPLKQWKEGWKPITEGETG